VFGSNGPLWSLSYEFWYYILFPALMLAAVSWMGVRLRVLYLGFALLVFWFVGPAISLYFLIWLAGAAVGRLRRITWLQAPRRLAFASAAGGLLFASALSWNRVKPISSEAAADFVICVCFVSWLFILLHGIRKDASPAYAKSAKALSGFSYTLYLVHFPALLVLRGLLDPQGSWQPDPLHLFYGLGIASLILGYAYLVAEFTEGRTTAVRRRLLQPWAPRTKEVAE
jgi:peptidoglycan/LPS O-acetylase OafA/YrhL